MQSGIEHIEAKTKLIQFEALSAAKLLNRKVGKNDGGSR
jgi:hypothetical protein